MKQEPTVETSSVHSQLLEEFQCFLEEYKDDLDPTTTFKMISSHGRMEEVLFFATLLGVHIELYLYHCLCFLQGTMSVSSSII